MDVITLDVNTLDHELVEILRGEIRRDVIKACRTIPYGDEEEEAIKKVLDHRSVERYNNIIRDYYYSYLERDVLCTLSQDDFYKIYSYRV